MVKKPLYILGIFLSSYLNSFNVFLTKEKEQIKIEQIKSGVLEKECDLFVNSFLNAYKDISFVDLGLPDQLEQTRINLLRRSFHNGSSDLQKADANLYFYNAYIKAELVGIISFELINDATVYVRQLAVAAQYKRQGIGCALIMYCLENFPDKNISLVVRKLNTDAKLFFKKLGFSETSNLYNHDEQHFIGFSLYPKKMSRV